MSVFIKKIHRNKSCWAISRHLMISRVAVLFVRHIVSQKVLIISGSYAFLEFDEEDDARKAIDEMNHKDFKGQTLNVELGGQIKRAKVI